MWLDKTITDLKIILPGYYIMRHDRNRRSGSIMLCVRDTSASQVHPTLELLTAELTLKQGPLLLGLFYHPPSADHSLE